MANSALQCDGVRPTCSSCERLSVACFYDVAEGQTRQQSLKKKHEALKRDLGGSVELLWHIQHAPETDVQTIVSRLRRGNDPSAILATIQSYDTTALPANALQPHTRQYTAPTPSHTQTGLPDLSDSRPLAATLRAQGDVLMEAFSTFLQCTATIFHIYTQDEVEDLLTDSLQVDDQVPLSTLCEICGIAAVGSRFSRSKISPEMGEFYFSVTKQLLDECIEKTPLQAMKVCALLAMCNIINKATAAFAYVGQCRRLIIDTSHTKSVAELGLGVARIKGLIGRERHPDLDLSTWLEGRKVAKSLLLCRG